MDIFGEWLVGEAGATWILGILGIIGALYGWSSRRRDKHIFVLESRYLSLLDIHPRWQDRLVVLYQHMMDLERRLRTGCASGFSERHEGENFPIKTLYQTEFVIYNSGTQDFTEPFEFTIHFYAAKNRKVQGIDGYWEMLLEDSRAGCKPLVKSLSNGIEKLTSGCIVKLTRLNSWPRERDFIRGYLVSENPIYIGSHYQGAGWSSEHRKAKEQKETRFAVTFDILFASDLTLIVLLGLLGVERIPDSPSVLSTLIAYYILTAWLPKALDKAMNKRISKYLSRRFPATPLDLEL